MLMEIEAKRDESASASKRCFALRQQETSGYMLYKRADMIGERLSTRFTSGSITGLLPIIKLQAPSASRTSGARPPETAQPDRTRPASSPME